MPRKKKTKEIKNEFKEFINIHFTEAEKKEINGLDIGAGQLVGWMAERVEEGYSYTFSYDHYSDTTQVVCSAKFTKGDDAGYAFSMRHDVLDKALRSVFFVQEVKYPDGTWALKKSFGGNYDW